MKEAYVAIDFGGGSGRVIAGCLFEGELVLDTIYRFPNRQVRMGGHVYWDFLSLFEDMKTGIRMAVEKGYTLKSIGIDTWGVDFGLIDKQGNLLGNPVCYRDSRTEGMPEEFFSKVDVKAHYAESGTQVMAINTLFQLYAMKKEDNAQLKVADKLLFMPDLFSYYLTGVANNEYSIASTSELLDAKARTWNFKLIRELGLPEYLFGEVVMPGTSRGFLKPEIKEQIGIDYEVEVIAVAGVMSDEPILTEEARLAGFTNEGGTDGKICFLQNITGLWIPQKLMQEWKEEGKDVAYSTLLPAAEVAETDALIDVDDTVFQCPVSMAEAITNYCIAHQQTSPSTQGEFVKCVLRSLALRYKTGMEALNRLLPEPVTKLYVIGGGSQNKYLNRLTEEAIGIPVVEGPVEATAIGNIRQQMK